ncbi:hypothetical protein KHF85_19560 [Xanthomonas translucens pv. graminis]|uniref:hypothetical protein n=1 Tax=Xanthomonas graminis TaxID=3390026 RepID=UPI00254231AB|nr:hypothetical protein [Xanthomonas translucens]WIH04912.1 hypothetical protein KHF85_19560 [Xanthomonas translucens pv. graminis]
MKNFIVIVIFILLVGCSESIEDSSGRKVGRISPYVYCNVYLQEACFGIAPGDKLEMKINIDFTYYRVFLPGKRIVEIYYGTSPGSSEPGVTKNSWSSTDGEVKIFITKSLGNNMEAQHYLYKPYSSKVGNVSHLKLFNCSKEDKIIKSFVDNFRPCISTDSGISCSEKFLFHVAG